MIRPYSSNLEITRERYPVGSLGLAKDSSMNYSFVVLKYSESPVTGSLAIEVFIIDHDSSVSSVRAKWWSIPYDEYMVIP